MIDVRFIAIVGVTILILLMAGASVDSFGMQQSLKTYLITPISQMQFNHIVLWTVGIATLVKTL